MNKFMVNIEEGIEEEVREFKGLKVTFHDPELLSDVLFVETELEKEEVEKVEGIVVVNEPVFGELSR